MKLRNVSSIVLLLLSARTRVDLKGREGWPAYVGVCGVAEWNNRDLSKRHSPETISSHGGMEDPCALTSTYLLLTGQGLQFVDSVLIFSRRSGRFRVIR